MKEIIKNLDLEHQEDFSSRFDTLKAKYNISYVENHSYEEIKKSLIADLLPIFSDLNKINKSFMVFREIIDAIRNSLIYIKGEEVKSQTNSLIEILTIEIRKSLENSSISSKDKIEGERTACYFNKME